MAKKKKKQTTAYSSDSLVALAIIGALLVALGVMTALAVLTNMRGDVFMALKRFSRGLMGSITILLPVLLCWGGGLVFYTAHKKPPMRSFVTACAMVLVLCAVMSLLTFLPVNASGSSYESLMDHLWRSCLEDNVPADAGAFLSRAFELGSEKGYGGGLLGMLLAYPLWKGVGVGFGATMLILVDIALFLFMLQLDWRSIGQKLRQLMARLKAWQTQRQEQRRQQEEQLWQQQAAQAAQPVQLAQQPVVNAPNGWENMMPAGTTNWNQLNAQPQPQSYAQPSSYPQPYPPVTEPQETPRHAHGFRPVQEKPAAVGPLKPLPPIFRSEVEQNPLPEMPQEEAKPRKRGLFGLGEAAQGTEKPRKKGFFDLPLGEEAAPAELSPAPTSVPVSAAPAMTGPVSAPSPARATHEDASTPAATEVPDRPVARSEQRSAAAPAPEEKQPRRAWADIPPWEDASGAYEIVQPEEAVVPVLTQERPEGAWEADLKLPPRRDGRTETFVEEKAIELPYVFPTMDLLKQPDYQAGIDPVEDAQRSQRLENTLNSFRIQAKVRHITHGPAISRFELELAEGIRVNKVTDLNRNIAMDMEVKSVRIEAPIPGKSLVGVEVPNRNRVTVTLREVLESDVMRGNKKPLAVALGKDIAGVPILCDLAKMPHLLIAGATGSGKSVCINTIINSILYRCSPKEVRLILVDPKVVELQCYNGIPHLLIPVVSDPHKASGALAWAVGEMMERYKKFQERGVRAIDGYNDTLDPEEERMPRIVIIIDELADLMMTCKKDVEERICRLAQLARAAGIHLVVATQRPSVDVITGLIKANIPSRIAFRVSSNVDSRTILDRIGAEQLLGNGDMLFLPMGEIAPIRVQGCFLTDAEVNRITDFIRENSPADYDPTVLEELDKVETDGDPLPTMMEPTTNPEEGDDGDLLLRCVEMAVQDGQLSTSLIQRRFKLGYARAGRIVDEMEKRGIISQKDGAKPRMCLITREEFEEMKADGRL